MSLQAVLNYLKKGKEYGYLQEQFKQFNYNLVYGVTGSQKSVLATLFIEMGGRPLLYLV